MCRYFSTALDVNEAMRSTGGSFGYPSALYKVTDRLDSQVYALRRFDNVKTTNQITKNAQASTAPFCCELKFCY